MKLNAAIQKIKSLGPEFAGAKQLFDKLKDQSFRDRFIVGLEEELGASEEAFGYSIPSSLMHLGIDDSHGEEVVDMIKRQYLPPAFDFQKILLSEDIEHCLDLGVETSLFYEKAHPVMEDLLLIVSQANSSPQELAAQIKEAGISVEDAQNVASTLAILSLHPIPDKIMYLSDKAMGAATLASYYKRDLKEASNHMSKFLLI